MNRFRAVAGFAIGFALFATGSPSVAQEGPAARSKPVESVAMVAAGSIHGVVTDPLGAPLEGVMVAALGGRTVFAITDSLGRFALRTLPAGAYVVRAHLAGFIPSRREIVEVRPSARAEFTAVLRPAAEAEEGKPGEYPVLAAGLITFNDGEGAGSSETAGAHDRGELVWRLRHIPRSALKETTERVAIGAGLEAEPDNDPSSLLARALEGSMRLAAGLFDDLPLTGQVNLLTSASLDGGGELLSPHGIGNGVAYLTFGAPAGHGDWSVEAAMTQGDLASWFLAGGYRARAPISHRYSIGVSYVKQDYEGGNPAALAAVSNGNRNAGSIYGFDEWRVAPNLHVAYGANYSRYDYLAGSGLLSPRVGVILTPHDRWRLNLVAARSLLAPGAEEFAPTTTTGPWLAPERTFSPVSRDHGFRPEAALHYEVGIERDLSDSYVLGFRTFSQSVVDQMVALFGVQLGDAPGSDLGHYYVASGGDLTARGWGVHLSRPFAGGFRGSIHYAFTSARWTRLSDANVLLASVAPSVVRPGLETAHDLTTAVETEIPGTATRLYVLYKLNSAFARENGDGSRSGVDARFDLQVNQRLPFLNFSSAELEILVAVRNFFRDSSLDHSIYDELLVVRPPKRSGGGVMVRF
jgi:hypothetical protein